MKVLVDISNIIPGVGGSGGGVAVHANNLLNELDSISEKGQIICFVNKKNNVKEFKNLEVKFISFETHSIVKRIVWLNVILPYYCLKYRVDILHRVVPELPFFKVCKYICTLHDLMFLFHLKSAEKISLVEKVKARIYGYMLRTSLASATSIIVPSLAIKNETIQKLRIKASKIFVTHAGVKNFNDCRISKNRINADPFRFLVVAGFYPHKGHKNIIELAKILIENGYNNFEITLRGNPAYLKLIEDIKELIVKNHLSRYVIFSDFEKEHDLESMYNAYDCFLLLSEYEGFGLPVLEAQMAGLPVICSNISIFKEVLEESAIFIDIHNASINTESVQELMLNYNLREKFIGKGFKNCERFSWNKMAMETYEIYKSL